MIKLFGKELNLEEIFVGACIQFPFYFLVGWWVLLLMIVSGLLWSYGGASGTSTKAWRRIGVPFVTSLTVALTNPGWWWILSFIPIGWAITSIGYGIPDNGDEGSFLGRFWKKILKDPQLINYAVRLTTYILYWISFGLTVFVLEKLGAL